jgi:acetolactate synthase-1/3 small subunit
MAHNEKCLSSYKVKFIAPVKSNMKNSYLLTILSEDKKGIVSIIMNMLNRKQIEIESLSATKTDISTQVQVVLEIIMESNDLKQLVLKIQNIIEVYKVETSTLNNAWYQKVGIYHIAKDSYNSELYSKLQKHGATIVGYDENVLIIQKTGRDENLTSLYNELESPHLIRFAKSAAISLQNLNNDETPVIKQAA